MPVSGVNQFYPPGPLHLFLHGASTMVEGCQAGGLGDLLHYMRKYNAESPKQGRKRFNSIVKTIYFDHLVISYLCAKVFGHLHELFIYTICSDINKIKINHDRDHDVTKIISSEEKPTKSSCPLL